MCNRNVKKQKIESRKQKIHTHTQKKTQYNFFVQQT